VSAPVALKAISFSSQIEVIWEEGCMAFTWKGGEYIEVRRWTEDERNEQPDEVINVFDYERGMPEIATMGQMEGVIAEWIMANQAVALLGLE
jgi:hypothetical protein